MRSLSFGLPELAEGGMMYFKLYFQSGFHSSEGLTLLHFTAPLCKWV